MLGWARRFLQLTCFDRYWLSWLWVLSTCLDMVAREDRLSSRFSIVSYVYLSRNDPERSHAGSTDGYAVIMRLGQSETLVVSPRSGSQQHVPDNCVKILSTCERGSANPSGSAWTQCESSQCDDVGQAGIAHMYRCIFRSRLLDYSFPSTYIYPARDGRLAIVAAVKDLEGERSSPRNRSRVLMVRGKMWLLPVQWSLGATLQWYTRRGLNKTGVSKSRSFIVLLLNLLFKKNQCRVYNAWIPPSTGSALVIQLNDSFCLGW